ncbi:fibrocystin-L-like [Macrobrachium rosenbergii]|uniref:fibrocystin-L-like n=1 Tax=Macrobrachium rosenbergii TaxID=79674 RepID=UPI0034D7464E
MSFGGFRRQVEIAAEPRFRGTGLNLCLGSFWPGIFSFCIEMDVHNTSIPEELVLITASQGGSAMFIVLAPRSCNTKMLLCFALLSLLVGCASGQVTDVSPYWLGEGGGQTLYVSGKGFSPDQFNHFDSNLGNVVRLVNEADTIPCDIINYLTNTERIVCAVRGRENSKAPLAYVVKVFADGVEVESDKIVEFRSWISPIINGIDPVSAMVGSMVTINGYMHTDRYQRMDPEDPLETDFQSGRILTKLYMGGRDCLVYNETSNEPYGYLTDRMVSCIPTSSYGGPMNATAYVTDRGSSVHSKGTIRVDPQDRLYQHLAFPGILSISPSNGGSTGGTLLTINGVGFDPNPGTSEVKVGGAVCEIEEVTDNVIRYIS